MLEMAASLPEGQHLRALMDATPAGRLVRTIDSRDLGHDALAQLNLPDPQHKITERLRVVPPWHDFTRVIFILEVGPDGRRDHSLDLRRMAAEEPLANLHEEATWIRTDGSADGGVGSGGRGAVSMLPDGDTRVVRIATGSL